MTDIMALLVGFSVCLSVFLFRINQRSRILHVRHVVWNQAALSIPLLVAFGVPATCGSRALLKMTSNVCCDEFL
jgi:hypothetical protein